MVQVVQEFLEILHWKLAQVLDREGISMLQWAFMQRAFDRPDGVPFSQIREVTGEPKDNVRRAAISLRGFAKVIFDPDDRRARKLVLTKRGRKRAGFVFMRFERELLQLLGARDRSSNRAEEFKYRLWNASAYLEPSDLASEEEFLRYEENRELIPDNSLRHGEEPEAESIWTKQDPSDDWIPW
jgi:DNA-binding MarR family transcriptional regulator